MRGACCGSGVGGRAFAGLVAEESAFYTLQDGHADQSASGLLNAKCAVDNELQHGRNVLDVKCQYDKGEDEIANRHDGHHNGREAGNALRGEAENVFGREAGNVDDESSDDEPRDEREDFIHPERLELRRKGEAKRLAIEAEFRKINALDPTVKSFDDLMLMENAEEFAEKVRKGYSLSDAFIITNSKKLSEKLKNSAVRAALLRLGTKQHLVSTSTGGGEAAVDVPAETYSLYKTLYPDITDREIKKHYKKHNK